jgi:hypothetical protein
VTIRPRQKARPTSPYGWVKWAVEATIPGVGDRAGRPSLKLVLVVLASHADADGTCFPSAATIGDEAGLSEDHVSRVLAELDELGLIARSQRRHSGRFTSNTYELAPQQNGNGAGPQPHRPAAAPSGTTNGDRPALLQLPSGSSAPIRVQEKTPKKSPKKSPQIARGSSKGSTGGRNASKPPSRARKGNGRNGSRRHDPADAFRSDQKHRPATGPDGSADDYAGVKTDAEAAQAQHLLDRHGQEAEQQLSRFGLPAALKYFQASER